MKKLEKPQMKLHTCSQLAFHIVTKAIQWGKNNLFNNCTGNIG